MGWGSQEYRAGGTANVNVKVTFDATDRVIALVASLLRGLSPENQAKVDQIFAQATANVAKMRDVSGANAPPAG